MSTLEVTLTGIAPATLTLEIGTPGPQGPAGQTGPQGPAGPAGPGASWGAITGTLSAQTDLNTALGLKAPLLSPVFTGNPQGVTAALGDNDTTLATTAFVQQELASGTAVAKNLEVLVRNQTGSTLAAGAIVYINGATGNLPTVTLAQANNDANSAQTMGFVKAAIANNGQGYVIVRGKVEALDTSALTEGAQLYLSPTTAGAWTTTKPSAPQHLVYVGIVVRSHPTLGVILVSVQNGFELNELHDVQITTPTNGQVLKYNSSTGLWVNGTDSSGVAWGAITGTLSAQTDLNTALGLKYDASNPSGFITASALSPYLTSATAASTYQTISGMSSYLTTSSAASTYQTQSGMSNYLAKADNLSGLASTSTARTNLGLGTISTVNDAPSDGSTYGRNNGAWVVAGGGGGATWGSITGTLSSQSDLNTALGTKANLSGAQFTGKVGIGIAADATAALKVDTNGIMFGDGTTQTTAAYSFNGGGVSSPITYFDGFNTFFLGLNSSISLSGVGVNNHAITTSGLVIGSGGTITFGDSTTMSTAPTGMSPPSSSNAIWYSGAWYSANVSSVYDNNTMNYVNVLSF